MVRRRHILSVICISVLALAAAGADEPSKKQDRTIDPAKLPPGAVIIISDNPRDALRQVDAIVLSPAEYRKLLESAEQGRRAQEEPETPSVCRIEGRVEHRGGRGVAVLSATMKFRTTKPRSVVAVGLNRCKPTAATTDGQLAVFSTAGDNKGFAVAVSDPGEHTVQIEFETPLTVRLGEISFELGLPGAAITALERLQVPEAATDLRVGGRPVSKSHLAGGTAMLLGPAKSLDVRWHERGINEGAAARMVVECKTEVAFGDNAAVSRSRLTVRWPAGSASPFEVVVAGDARLGFEPPDSAVIEEPTRLAGITRWIVRPADALSECALEVEARLPFEYGSPMSIGPARVVGAARQRGTFSIGGGQVRLAPEPLPGAAVARRESPESAPNETVFTYALLPASGELVRVAPQKLPGQVDGQFQHQLSLNERGWRWQGRLELRPIRREVADLEIETPPELLECRSASPEVVVSFTESGVGPGGRRRWRLHFADPLRRPTSIALDGIYEFPETAREGVVSLPRMLNCVDRGGQVAVLTPNGVEARGTVREWSGDRAAETGRAWEAGSRSSNSATVATDRSPAQVALSWRATDRDGPVAATVYVQLGERQAAVRHQFRVPTASAASLRLTGPANLAGRIRGGQGTTIQPIGPGEWSVQPPSSTGGETIVTVHYSFPLSVNPNEKTEEVPLVWLDRFADVETDVHVWTGATAKGYRRPVQAIGPWTAVVPPVVADMMAIPSISMHGSGAELPLGVTMADSGGEMPPVQIERMWIQALIDPDGRQYVRIRNLLRPQGPQTIGLTLPRDATAAQFQALLDGKRVPIDPGPGGDATVRLRVDSDPARSFRLLEFTYIAPRSNNAVSAPYLARIETPKWEASAQLPFARWQIGFSDDRTAVAFGSIDSRESWSWERGLLELHPRWNSTALSKWFIGDARYGDLEAVATSSSLTAVGAIGEPVVVWLVPRAAAWLVCSVGLVIVGLGFVAAGPRVRAALGMLVVSGVGALATVNPQLVSAMVVYSQPGVAVLALAFACRTILVRNTRPGVFQSVGQLVDPATLPLVKPAPFSKSSMEPDAEPDLIPLKRI